MNEEVCSGNESLGKKEPLRWAEAVRIQRFYYEKINN